MTNQDDVIDNKSPRKLDTLRSNCRFDINSIERVFDYIYYQVNIIIYFYF